LEKVIVWKRTESKRFCGIVLRRATGILVLLAGILFGRATDALPENPKKETKKLDKNIEKLFKNFPRE
jgi:hypothetical protein